MKEVEWAPLKCRVQSFLQSPTGTLTTEQHTHGHPRQHRGHFPWICYAWALARPTLPDTVLAAPAETESLWPRPSGKECGTERESRWEAAAGLAEPGLLGQLPRLSGFNGAFLLCFSVLWLLIGSPGGPRRAHAASKQLPSEGVRERAARLQATCLSPSQEPSRHILEQAPKEAHSLV